MGGPGRRDRGAADRPAMLAMRDRAGRGGRRHNHEPLGAFDADAKVEGLGLAEQAAVQAADRERQRRDEVHRDQSECRPAALLDFLQVPMRSVPFRFSGQFER